MIKDIVIISLPAVLIFDMIFRFIIYKCDKQLKKANETILAEMKKTLTVFEDVQAFILEKLKEDTE